MEQRQAQAHPVFTCIISPYGNLLGIVDDIVIGQADRLRSRCRPACKKNAGCLAAASRILVLDILKIQEGILTETLRIIDGENIKEHFRADGLVVPDRRNQTGIGSDGRTAGTVAEQLDLRRVQGIDQLLFLVIRVEQD